MMESAEMALDPIRAYNRIAGILELAMRANGYEQRSARITGNKPTVFLYYSGHVNWIDVEIHSCGWDGENPPDMKFRIYLDDPSNETLDEIEAALIETARKGQEQE